MGSSHREFAELSKRLIVDVASSDFGIRGRPTNISRVAVMTGLTRKEVKRIRDHVFAGERSISVKTTPIAEVLHRWHCPALITDSDGNPECLSRFRGSNGSFSSLGEERTEEMYPRAQCEQRC